jgi:HEAT repeat protein
MGNPPDRAGGAGKSRGGQPAAGPRGASTGDARLAELNAPVSATQLREKALETIVGFARDENAQVRGAVVEAAGHSPRRLRSIIEAGLKDENAGVRTIAATVVGRTQQRDLLVATRPLLEDAQGEVRASAIFALAKNGVNVNQSPLGAMLLNDASPWVSRQAAFVIGELGNKSALPLLQSAARTRVGNLPAAQQRPFQLMLTEAMVKLGDEAQKPALRAALFPDGTSDLEGMALAIQILGETRDHEAKGQLISIVQYRDANGQSFPGEIRLGAAAALTKMGSGEGAIALADEYLFSSDERLRMQAANVYGEVRGTQAWGRLNKLMSDANPLVRVAAASAVLKASARGG